MGTCGAPKGKRKGPGQSALLLSFCLYPIAKAALPPEPADTAQLIGMIVREVLIGLMMGAVLQMFVTALSTAGGGRCGG